MGFGVCVMQDWAVMQGTPLGPVPCVLVLPGALSVPFVQCLLHVGAGRLLDYKCMHQRVAGFANCRAPSVVLLIVSLHFVMCWCPVSWPLGRVCIIYDLIKIACMLQRKLNRLSLRYKCATLSLSSFCISMHSASVRAVSLRQRCSIKVTVLVVSPSLQCCSAPPHRQPHLSPRKCLDFCCHHATSSSSRQELHPYKQDTT